jgi:hypothetical protein
MKFLVTENQFKIVISRIQEKMEQYLLNEGRNEEDALKILKKSGRENPEEIFNVLKKHDKSKSNKTLPVMATFYVDASNGMLTRTEQLDQIINLFDRIFNIKDKKGNPLPPPDISLTNNKIKIFDQLFGADEFSEFKDFVEHYLYEEEDYEKELEKEKKRLEKLETELVQVDANVIFENDNFKVWKAIHEKICIQLFGRDNEDRMYPISKAPFCIGWGSLKSPATHLKGYREQGKTFYAVLDKKRYASYEETKQMPTSMLNIIQVNSDGSYIVWNEKDVADDLSPAEGTSMGGYSNKQEYLDHLKSGGINLEKIFKIIPYVPDTNQLIDYLNDNPNSEKYFNAMSPFLKKEYAKQAKILTPKQIKFFLSAGDKKSVDMFVKNYTVIANISREAFLSLPFGMQTSYIRSKLIQLVNKSGKFDLDTFFQNYIGDPNHINYAINFIKESFEKNNNINKDISLRVLSILSPEFFLETLKTLDVVKINNDNFKLRQLPENFGEYLTNAKELTLENLNIESIPESIGMAKNLTTLIIYRCPVLSSIPSSIGELINLDDMNITNNNNLDTIPDSIGQLVNLSHLNLSDNDLRTLPNSIGNLKNLFILNLDGNPMEPIPSEVLNSCENLGIVTATIDGETVQLNNGENGWEWKPYE